MSLDVSAFKRAERLFETELRQLAVRPRSPVRSSGPGRWQRSPRLGSVEVTAIGPAHLCACYW